MNKMSVVKWYDPDTVDTIQIAAAAYNVKIEAVEPTGEPDEAYVCVYGPTENVDRFVEDVDEGAIDPFDLKAELGDDEYQEWLSEELCKFGCLYIPKINGEAEDED